MKKLFVLILTIAVLSIASVAYAAKNETGSQGASTQGQQQVATPPPSTSNQVQNQNQVKTQNQGEDSQIQTNTQEQENLGENQETQGQGMPKRESPRSQTAIEHMSAVAQKVEELLTTKTMRGGIGEQVREIAQEQNQAQVQIRKELNKLETKNNFLKKLFGADYKTIGNLNQQMEQNRSRILQLQQLTEQVENQADQAKIQEAVLALTEQNTALQEQVLAEENSGSLLRWLVKLFVR